MDLKPVYKTVVGMDVHQKTILACVMTFKGNDTEPTIVTCEFKTYKGGLNILAQWCKDHGAEAITMESTGIHWKSPYRTLKEAGFSPPIVNARHVKALRGRKTDPADSIWLAWLTMPGLHRRQLHTAVRA
jgi:transposase